MAKTKGLKPLKATYDETPEYRERRESLGLIRYLVAIDGEKTLGIFSMAIEDSTAWAIQKMTLLILKGMKPDEAFKEAFPSLPLTPAEQRSATE